MHVIDLGLLKRLTRGILSDQKSKSRGRMNSLLSSFPYFEDGTRSFRRFTKNAYLRKMTAADQRNVAQALAMVLQHTGPQAATSVSGCIEDHEGRNIALHAINALLLLRMFLTKESDLTHTSTGCDVNVSVSSCCNACEESYLQVMTRVSQFLCLNAFIDARQVFASYKFHVPSHAFQFKNAHGSFCNTSSAANEMRYALSTSS